MYEPVIRITLHIYITTVVCQRRLLVTNSYCQVNLSSCNLGTENYLEPRKKKNFIH